MSYLLVPDLLAILWMAVVLSHLRSRHSSDFLHLWITGLGLIVVEGVARILYLAPLSSAWHQAMHVIALDGYFLAGVAFFQSATGRLRYLRNGTKYLMLCVVPGAMLITLYGASMHGDLLYTCLAWVGLIASLTGALVFRRPLIHLFCHGVVWIPVIVAARNGELRGAAYLLLFDIYAATAIAFRFTLPRERWGRTVVVAGFFCWSLCFLTHPWIAVHRPDWVPLVSKIWDLQKFIVTFGLLIVTLEADSAVKEYQALHDTLTGLPNRRLFRDRLELALAQALRKGSRTVLFNIDLDGFKQVNDLWGHEAGDALLREIGIRLAAVTRQSDTLARMGGDEFNLLIHDFHPESRRSVDRELIATRCTAVKESFRQSVEKNPFLLDTQEGLQRIQPRLSIGLAIFPDQANSMEELCRLADLNMYADKRSRSAIACEVLPQDRESLQLAPQSVS